MEVYSLDKYQIEYVDGDGYKIPTEDWLGLRLWARKQERKPPLSLPLKKTRPGQAVLFWLWAKDSKMWRRRTESLKCTTSNRTFGATSEEAGAGAGGR